MGLGSLFQDEVNISTGISHVYWYRNSFADTSLIGDIVLVNLPEFAHFF